VDYEGVRRWRRRCGLGRGVAALFCARVFQKPIAEIAHFHAVLLAKNKML